MALQNKRIVDLPERSTLNADDYTVIDGQTGGTGKYKLSTLQEDVTGAKQNITQLTQTVTAQGQQISTNTRDITDLKEDLSEATGYSEITIQPTDEEPYAGYWSRSSSGVLSLASSTTYYTTYNLIDISSLSVGTEVKVLASVNGSYGAFIADAAKNVLDYVNGSNASEKGYTTSGTPQIVTFTVPSGAKYIASDIRTIKYTGMSDFSATGIQITKIDDISAELTSVSQICDVISNTMENEKVYIFPSLEVGALTITTDADTHWTYATGVYNRIRTKEGFTIHLYPGDTVGFDSYANGEVFALGWRYADGTYGRALLNKSDYTVEFEGDYVIDAYQEPKITYTDIYTLGHELFIKRAVHTEKPYKRLDKFPLKGIGHRGYTSEGAPENTIWSFRAAKTKGFHFVETDVAWTSDNVAVLMHDPTINRTGRNADGSEIANTINIHDITYAQALTYDFGIWKGEQYAGTKIMTVKELLIFCRANDMFPHLELKSNVGFSKENITAVINDIKKYGMLDCCTFISFSYGNLRTVTVVEPSVKVERIASSFDDAVKNQLLILKTRYNTVGLVAYNDILQSMGDEIIAYCLTHGIVLGNAMTNDKTVMENMDDYITECSSEVYVFDKVIAEREMGQ